jgi:D-alanyl-D-alanine carboxypeptidase/D-alanyl-D-alanine-endopeptidase (penicillin-binding protein 4)
MAALTAKLDGAVVGTTTCLSVEDGSGRILYQHQPDAPLIPASTQKLLVAEAALATLGPNYRFTTSVKAPAAPVKGQVAALWLVGNGDPLLATPEFIASTVGRVRVADYPWTPLVSLADALVAAGVKAVPGGVRGDDSAEDRLRFLPVWPALYQQQSQVGLLSALSVNEGIQFTPPKSTLAQDPPAYAASELARLLQSHQLPIGSQPDQAAPAGAVVLASVSSAPVSQIVEAMLRASDNWIAELLVRAIDKATGGSGTTAGGVRTVLQLATAAGIPMSGAHMDDGSGLSRTDRATCRELLAALDVASRPANAAVIAGLAVAGETGTLAARYRGSPIAGKLQAKTGSLDNAGGMVGIETVGAPVRFAFLDNDVQSDTALLAREDAIVGALAAYPGG